jgi:CHASE3 domain sensor protein
MKRFFSDNWIVLVIGIAFVISTLLAIRNNYIIDKNHLLLQETDLVKQRTEEILSQIMHGLDLGVRGYALTHDDKLLDPYNQAKTAAPAIIRQLDSLLVQQNYSGRAELDRVKDQIDQYIKFSEKMIEQARDGQMDVFSEMLKEDRGYDVWLKYSEFSRPLFAYEDKLNEESLKDYQRAIRNNLILQVAILLLVTPMLYVFVSKVKKDRQLREMILNEVDQTDRTFVFNDGGNTSAISEEVNKRSNAHIKQASEFIAAIAEDNYEVDWHGLVPENQDLNNRTLAGNLIRLRDRLKAVREDDERRNWVNEGIAKFSEIVRTYQHRGEEFYIKSISYLANYIQAQQGSLFIVEGEGKEQHLKLVACYAFDKKKWIEKRIEIGSGLIGQAFLEGEPVKLKQIPKNYIQITSGLGDASPDCLVIIPMKHDEQTTVIAEFASFNDLEDYQIGFLQKTGEFLASAIVNVSTTQKMKTLLEEASLREEHMKQREEELRQSMEELQAIQEEMSRKGQTI